MSYGWFNVLKGDYPSINMPTKDAVVTKVSGKELVRGSVFVATGAGSCKIVEAEVAGAAADTRQLVYWALQGEENAEAIEAGTVTNPKVVGLPNTMPMEIETDQYDDTNPISVGDLLTVIDGKVVKADAGTAGLNSTDHALIVGICTAAPPSTERWLNDKPVNHPTGYRQGTMASVIRFETTNDPDYVIP